MPQHLAGSSEVKTLCDWQGNCTSPAVCSVLQSDSFPLLQEVPQGSSLGPVLSAVYTGKLFEIVCTLTQTRLSSLIRKTPTRPARLTAPTVLTAPTNYSDYTGLAPSILNIFVITNLCYLVTLAASPTQWSPLASAQNSCGHLMNVWEKMWNL